MNTFKITSTSSVLKEHSFLAHRSRIEGLEINLLVVLSGLVLLALFCFIRVSRLYDRVFELFKFR